MVSPDGRWIAYVSNPNAGRYEGAQEPIIVVLNWTAALSK